MGFKLTIDRGPASGPQRLFDRGAIIGRASGCDLIVDDASASRRHARIYREGPRYFLEDLASSNGTKLNGSAAQKAQLSDGDAIAIGAAVLRFWVENGSAREAAAVVLDESSTRILSGPGGSERQRSAVLESTDLQAGRAKIRRRTAIVACAGAGLALLLLLAVSATARRGWSAAAPEPETLGPVPIEESFGVGDGVTYPRPDGKAFELELHAPGRALAILHFHSRDISPGQVRVSANGAQVGMVPADAVNTDLSHQIRIGPDLLKRGEKNRIAFESARDRSQRQKWRIWNLWAEIVMLPEMPPEQLLREAHASFRRGQQNLEHRDVGAANRYLAWKEFRASWLTLEAHPDPKPDLYLLARDRLQEAQQELDRLCSRLMLEIHRAQQVKDWRAARATLDQVKLYFPGSDQQCAHRAEQKRAELD